jgi:plastocyanin
MRRVLLVSALVVLLLAAGCGSDDESERAGTGTGGGATQDGGEAGGEAKEIVRIEETDFALEPKDVEVPEAGVIEFEVENAGQAPHALEVEGNGVEEETKELAPGERDSLKVELEPGTYTTYCPIGDHRERGMEGKVVVAGGSGSGEEDSGEDGGGGPSGY